MSLGRKYSRWPKAAVGSASTQPMSQVGSSELTARTPRSCSSRHRSSVKPGALELHHCTPGPPSRRWRFQPKLTSTTSPSADLGAAVGGHAHEVVELEQVAGLPVAVGDVDDDRAPPQRGDVERVHRRLRA